MPSFLAISEGPMPCDFSSRIRKGAKRGPAGPAAWPNSSWFSMLRPSECLTLPCRVAAVGR
jgi:hypothetical protein